MRRSLLVATALIFWVVDSDAALPPGTCVGAQNNSAQRNSNYAELYIHGSSNWIGWSGVGECGACICPENDHYEESGVAFYPVNPGNHIDVIGIWQDEDQVYCGIPPYIGCPSCNCLAGGTTSPGDLRVYLDNPGTEPIAIAITDINGFQAGTGYTCYNDTIEAMVIGYVHVFEVEVNHGGSLPMNVVWTITPFTDSVCVDDYEPITDVRLTITGANGIYQTPIRDSWSESFQWDGEWSSAPGTYWDGCSQIVISVGGSVNSVYVDPNGCGGCTVDPLPFEESETIGCLAHPINYRKISGEDIGNGYLRFRYAWDSSTGIASDLTDVEIGEIVYYPGPPPNPPFLYNTFPNPFEKSTNGHIMEWVDTHDHKGFTTYPPGATFIGTQYYRYRCPGMEWQNLMGPISISRYVEDIGGWRYRITKDGHTAILVLP